VTAPLEGHLVHEPEVAILKARFARLDEPLQHEIRAVADSAGGRISLNPATERRVGIARILLEIAEQEGHIDHDLVRSICGLRTGKQYLTAGAALADLSWIDAERVWFTFQQIYAGNLQLEYNQHSNEYTITKENTHDR
jgi:hypothetical protein